MVAKILGDRRRNLFRLIKAGFIHIGSGDEFSVGYLHELFHQLLATVAWTDDAKTDALVRAEHPGIGRSGKSCRHSRGGAAGKKSSTFNFALAHRWFLI